MGLMSLVGRLSSAGVVVAGALAVSAGFGVWWRRSVPPFRGEFPLIEAAGRFFAVPGRAGGEARDGYICIQRVIPP